MSFGLMTSTPTPLLLINVYSLKLSFILAMFVLFRNFLKPTF